MSPPPEARRLLFLDVLRLIAAAQMIQGHSVSAVLAPEYRHGFGFALWTFARGLTSVLFLTAAGLSFVLAEQRSANRAARKRRSLRALRLIAIGYAMHLPYGSLGALARESGLAAALAVDVLQCIGMSLLALEGLTALVAHPRARMAVAFALGVTCFALAPLLYAADLSALGLPVAQYLTARGGSLFPLFPWAGYLFLGFAIGTAILRPRHGPAEVRAYPSAGRQAAVLGGTGLCLVTLGLLLRELDAGLAASISPSYAAIKFGTVLALAALAALACDRLRALPPRLARLASETLFLYVSHVVVLYADGVGLASRIGETQSPLAAVALALALLVASCAGALGSRPLARAAPRLFRRREQRAPERPESPAASVPRDAPEGGDLRR